MAATRLGLSYIHAWDFSGVPDVDFTIDGDGTVTRAKHLELKLVTNPAAQAPGQPAQVYAVGGNVFVRTASFSPGAWLSWGFIELQGATDDDSAGNPITTLDVRVFDGTNQLYWDGAAWSAITDTTADWNTLAVLNANLPALTSPSIAIEVRLQTVDREYTPVLSSVCLKWVGKRISFYREWVIDTVLGSLVASLNPLTDYPVSHVGGDIIALVDHPLDASWEITGVEAVYDHDADPAHTTDLFASYDAAERLVTLTSPVDAGVRLWIVASYKPQIAITTSSDYLEGGKSPAVLLTLINPDWNGKSIGSRGPVIIDRTASPAAGTVYPNPIQLVDIDFTFATVAPTALDLIALNEAMSSWLDAHPTLHSTALGQSVKMYPGSTLDWNTTTDNVKDPRFATGSFQLRNVPMIGDSFSGAGDGNASKVVGPIDAGDPSAPGVGYAVSKIKVAYPILGSGTSSGQEIS